MTAWTHLPNAKYIDQVLASVKANPESWSAAWDATRGAAWNAAWNAARNAAWDATRDASQNAIAALIAYDDSSRYLKMTPDQLRIWGELGEDPAAVLLFPAVVVYHKLKST